MIARTRVSAEADEYRDQRWQREGSRQVETAFDAERFIERVGFAACLTDSRRPGPSLYVAVCGRRDAIMPRNVQKDPEASHTWLLKDELVRRGRVYYGKLTGLERCSLRPAWFPSSTPCGEYGAHRSRPPESSRAGDSARVAPRVGNSNL